MPSEILRDAFVELNAVDLSDRVKSVTLNYSAETKDTTQMGDVSKRRLAGLKDWSLDVEFYQDYTVGEVDATLFALVGAAQFAVKVRKSKTDAVGATNPEYRGNGIVDGDYQAVGGNVGDEHMTKVKIVASDGAALIRAVA